METHTLIGQFPNGFPQLILAYDFNCSSKKGQIAQDGWDNQDFDLHPNKHIMWEGLAFIFGVSTLNKSS